MRFDTALRLLRQRGPRPSGGCSSGCSRCCYRGFQGCHQVGATAPLSHGLQRGAHLGHYVHRSRSFHRFHLFHKTRPAPAPQQPFSVPLNLENFRAVAHLTTTTTPLPQQHRVLLPRLSTGLRVRITPLSLAGRRFYSSRSSTTSPIMTEVKWTGPLVRKTFLDFFAERGHTIGMSAQLFALPAVVAATPRWCTNDRKILRRILLVTCHFYFNNAFVLPLIFILFLFY